jgi:hypothetical protein
MSDETGAAFIFPDQRSYLAAGTSSHVPAATYRRHGPGRGNDLPDSVVAGRIDAKAINFSRLTIAIDGAQNKRLLGSDALPQLDPDFSVVTFDICPSDISPCQRHAIPDDGSLLPSLNGTQPPVASGNTPLGRARGEDSNSNLDPLTRGCCASDLKPPCFCCGAEFHETSGHGFHGSVRHGSAASRREVIEMPRKWNRKTCGRRTCDSQVARSSNAPSSEVSPRPCGCYLNPADSGSISRHPIGRCTAPRSFEG